MIELIRETEVETVATHRRRQRMQTRFLLGPIPMPEIITATRLPGKSLSILLAIRHQIDLSRKAVVSLPKALLEEMGIDRDSKSRGLKYLEAAGLIVVERMKGRSARVRLINKPPALSGSGRVEPFANGQWAVCEAGLKTIGGAPHYQIPAADLTELVECGSRVYYKWPVQVAEKTWVDHEMFKDGFAKALEAHAGCCKLVIDNSILHASLEQMRSIASR